MCAKHYSITYLWVAPETSLIVTKKNTSTFLSPNEILNPPPVELLTLTGANQPEKHECEVKCAKEYYYMTLALHPNFDPRQVLLAICLPSYENKTYASTEKTKERRPKKFWCNSDIKITGPVGIEPPSAATSGDQVC